MDPRRRTYESHPNKSEDLSTDGNSSTERHENYSASGPANDNINKDGQPYYAGGYTMIPPNESKRSEVQRVAQKEEEDLQRWRESHKFGPVNLPPSRLGGAVSLAEARQKQFVDLRQSKLQKKLKQEEMERQRREAAEENNRKMKAIQREKAIKLEEKTKLEEQQRKEQYQQDHQLKTQQFLQRFEKSSPMTVTSSLPVSSWGRVREHQEAQKAEQEAFLMQMKEKQRKKSEILEEKQKQLEQQRERDMDTDRRRVNAAFFDKLQGNNRSCNEVRPLHSALVESGSGDHQPCEIQIPTRSLRPLLDQVANMSLQPDSPQVYTDKAKGEEHDHEWAMMKFLSRFPNYERGFLQDIVSQCNGDYEQACSLLE